MRVHYLEYLSMPQVNDREDDLRELHEIVMHELDTIGNNNDQNCNEINLFSEMDQHDIDEMWNEMVKISETESNSNGSSDEINSGSGTDQQSPSPLPVDLEMTKMKIKEMENWPESRSMNSDVDIANAMDIKNDLKECAADDCDVNAMPAPAPTHSKKYRAIINEREPFKLKLVPIIMI